MAVVFRSQGEHDIQYYQMFLVTFFFLGLSKMPAGGFSWGANVSYYAFSFFCVWCVWRTRGDVRYPVSFCPPVFLRDGWIHGNNG